MKVFKSIPIWNSTFKLYGGLARKIHTTNLSLARKLKNKKLERKLYPRMYPCIIVNQDGSSYHIEHEYPHHIITLPLDKSTLSEEELMARNKAKRIAQQKKYISEDDDDIDWDHSKYRELIR